MFIARSNPSRLVSNKISVWSHQCFSVRSQTHFHFSLSHNFPRSSKPIIWIMYECKSHSINYAVRLSCCYCVAYFSASFFNKPWIFLLFVMAGHQIPSSISKKKPQIHQSYFHFKGGPRRVSSAAAILTNS